MFARGQLLHGFLPGHRFVADVACGTQRYPDQVFVAYSTMAWSYSGCGLGFVHMIVVFGGMVICWIILPPIVVVIVAVCGGFGRQSNRIAAAIAAVSVASSMIVRRWLRGSCLVRLAFRLRAWL